MYNLNQVEYEYLEKQIGKQVKYYRTIYPEKVDEMWSIGVFAIGKACKKYDKSRTDAQFTTYATRAIINDLKHWHRSEKRTIGHLYLDKECFSKDDRPDTMYNNIKFSEPDVANNSQLRIDIERAMTCLSKKQREVIELQLEGLTQQQIADRLGVKLCAVQANIYRAYGKMKHHTALRGYENV